MASLSVTEKTLYAGTTAHTISGSGKDIFCIGFNTSGGYTAFYQAAPLWCRAKVHLDRPAASITFKCTFNQNYNLGTATKCFMGVSRYKATANVSGDNLPESTTTDFKGSGETFYVSSWAYSKSEHSMTVSAPSGGLLMPGDWYLYAYRRQYSSGAGALVGYTSGDYKSGSFTASYVESGGLVHLRRGSAIVAALPYAKVNGALVQLLPYVKSGGVLKIGV